MSGELIVHPGQYPVSMLDQTVGWVGPDGRARLISELIETDVLFAVDYSLANAKYLRDKWAFAKRETYDEDERPRQWMLGRPGIRALLRRLVELEDKAITEAAFEEAVDAKY